MSHFQHQNWHSKSQPLRVNPAKKRPPQAYRLDFTPRLCTRGMLRLQEMKRERYEADYMNPCRDLHFSCLRVQSHVFLVALLCFAQYVIKCGMSDSSQRADFLHFLLANAQLILWSQMVTINKRWSARWHYSMFEIILRRTYSTLHVLRHFLTNLIIGI